MRYLIISCSLNPDSRSRALANITLGHLKEKTGGAGLIDLQTLDLPMCDAGACYSFPQVQDLGRKIKEARGIIIAAPIYNYDINAATKNLLELTGRAWTGKVVGFICAAGGHGSYMSVMQFANSLMLDFRCHIIPRFLYAPSSGIDDSDFGDEAINRRAAELANELFRVTEALTEDGGT